MNHVHQEIAIYTRACERLLSKEGTLTADELGLVEFYVKELSRQLLPDMSPVGLQYIETGPVKPASAVFGCIR